MKDKNKTFLFLTLIILLNFLLLPIDSYFQNNYIYRLLNLKDKKSLIFEDKKTFYLYNTSDEINIFEFRIRDKKIYNSISSFDKKELDNLKKDNNFMLILSHLNLQSYLENNLQEGSLITLFFLNKKLNTNNYCNSYINGWDFIIIDKAKNKLTLVNYVKSRVNLSILKDMPDSTSGISLCLFIICYYLNMLFISFSEILSII